MSELAADRLYTREKGLPAGRFVSVPQRLTRVPLVVGPTDLQIHAVGGGSPSGDAVRLLRALNEKVRQVHILWPHWFLARSSEQSERWTRVNQALFQYLKIPGDVIQSESKLTPYPPLEQRFVVTQHLGDTARRYFPSVPWTEDCLSGRIAHRSYERTDGHLAERWLIEAMRKMIGFGHDIFFRLDASMLELRINVAGIKTADYPALAASVWRDVHPLVLSSIGGHLKWGGNPRCDFLQLRA